jgi:hypothetical protein
MIFAMASGLLFSVYGILVGVVGVGPDGPAPAQWRVVGCVALILGILDFLPKQWIRRKRRLLVAYCIMNALPLVTLGIFVARYLAENGLGQFVANGGLTTSLALTAMIILGPLPALLAPPTREGLKADPRGRIVK